MVYIEPPEDCLGTTVVVLNWNDWSDTIQCLANLRRHNAARYSVVVLDNGSTDGSVSHIIRWASQEIGPSSDIRVPYGDEGTIARILTIGKEQTLTLLAGRENLGFCGGCNVAIRFAIRNRSASYVYLLNNDAYPEPGAITETVRIASVSRAAIVGSVITKASDHSVAFAGSDFLGELFYLGRARRNYIKKYAHLKNVEYYPTSMTAGTAMLVRRDLLDARLQSTGDVFLPALFMYGDELELCAWARENGYTVVMAVRSLVSHGDTRSKPSAANLRSMYYGTRNILFVGRRSLHGVSRLMFEVYYPVCRLLLAAREVLRGHMEVGRAIAQGLRDGYRGRTGRWTRHDKGHTL
jgi:GT2 family glycosyltransferase